MLIQWHATGGSERSPGAWRREDRAWLRRGPGSREPSYVNRYAAGANLALLENASTSLRN